MSPRWLAAVAAFAAFSLFGAEPSAQSAPSGNPAWQHKTRVGVPRLFPGVETVHGKIIIFGGFDRVGGAPHLLAAVEEYDLASNMVTRKPDMPVARGFFGSAVVDGRIYVIGGYESTGASARVEAYDPAKGTWTARAPLTVARSGVRAAAVGDRIYAFGGFQEASTVFEVYDVPADRWTRLPDLRQPMLNPAVTVHGGRIYVVGGGIPNGTKAAGFLEVFDPATGEWSSLGRMPVPKGDHIVGIHQGRLFIVSGWNDVVLKSIEVLDLERNVWSTRPDLDDLRFYHGGALIDGKFWIVGGARGDTARASEYTNTIDRYDPALDPAGT